MPKPIPSFTIEELQAEMEKDNPAGVIDESGITTREIAEMFNVCQETARKWVSRWFRAGRVRVVHRHIQTISGKKYPVPAYIILPKEAE